MKKKRPDSTDADFWSSREVYTFPSLRIAQVHEGCACGAAMFSLLTGQNSKRVELSKRSHRDVWSTSYMLGRLKAEGFEITPVDIRCIPDPGLTGNVRSRFHVYLVAQHVSSTSGTWSVVWNRVIFHGSDYLVGDVHEFIVYPMEAVWMLWHPSWKAFTGSDKRETAIKLKRLDASLQKKIDTQWLMMHLAPEPR